jgi:FAD/FMN-containing dehydrogenase
MMTTLASLQGSITSPVVADTSPNMTANVKAIDTLKAIGMKETAKKKSNKVHCQSTTDYEVLVTNWAETVEAGAEQFRYPVKVEDVVEMIKENEKIRCSGALHSCAPLIESQGIILSLTKLDQIISIDTAARIVRMQAGVRMHDLCAYLADYCLAVGTLGTIDWQTICGAVMTGTHGGGLTIPSLHDFVRSYTIVLPDGALKRVDKETSPSLFRAMVSLFIAPSSRRFVQLTLANPKISNCSDF